MSSTATVQDVRALLDAVWPLLDLELEAVDTYHDLSKTVAVALDAVHIAGVVHRPWPPSLRAGLLRDPSLARVAEWALRDVTQSVEWARSDLDRWVAMGRAPDMEDVHNITKCAELVALCDRILATTNREG